MPSIYYPSLSSDQKPGDQIRLVGEEFHHWAYVAHRRIKETVILNSGKGIMAKAEAVKIEPSSALLQITEIIDNPYPNYPFAIAFALLKNRNDELIVEKCTELGVSAFFPLITDFSIRKPSDNTLSRFQKIAIAAIKQCNNPWLPEIFSPQVLNDAIKTIKVQEYNPILCSERKPEQWLFDLSAEEVGKPCFMIGAEGGWSSEEFNLMQDFPDICLAYQITRAETAAIVASAQWLAFTHLLELKK
ncbi:MAG: RsmE family RNA methyltransferase [Candidatus Syntrophosphaera sp.]|jgi:16S rRNA (uracil1498-N3)-methyltransferase|nr:RsmE family RNA methyltransferase [Candidatus Syntrophosphaera sp.]